MEKSCFVVSSLRADCLIAAVWHLSRTDAAAHFQAKRVFVNDVLCENVSYNVKDGDTVSVRGYGKFRFTGVAGRTKKGRLSAEAELYR